MARTFDWIWSNWDWPDDVGLGLSDGGDVRRARSADPNAPWTRCCSTRRRTHYRLNGHNHQRPGLTIYLPGNGGLLYATAMMAAGWDGAPEGNAPGFPRDGRWVVRWEGLRQGAMTKKKQEVSSQKFSRNARSRCTMSPTCF